MIIRSKYGIYYESSSHGRCQEQEQRGFAGTHSAAHLEGLWRGWRDRAAVKRDPRRQRRAERAVATAHTTSVLQRAWAGCAVAIDNPRKRTLRIQAVSLRNVQSPKQ